MTTATTTAGATRPDVAPPPAGPGMSADQEAAFAAWRAWWAILWRDIFVMSKTLWVLLAQVAIGPLFILFIFANVLGSLNLVSRTYGNMLLPGIVALSAFLAALQSMSLSLIVEFGWLREIEDRLLAPLPTALVAVEKLVVSTLQGLVSAVIMYPVGALVLGTAPWRPSGLPLLFVMVLLGSWVGGALGITIGTFLPVSRLNILFALIVTPIIFTGAVQYPWVSLNELPWFQLMTAFNPLTYCAEGVRAAVVPEVPHLSPWISAGALLGFGLLFSGLGMLGFRRRSWT